MCDDVSRINKGSQDEVLKGIADGTVDIHGTYSIHVGGYDWGSATDNKKAENNPSQAIKTGDTAHGEIYAMIMMFAATGYVFFKQRKGA